VHDSPLAVHVQGWIENPELVLGNVEVVSDMRAAQERKSPVVNARKARCQNFESNFIWGDKERRVRIGGGAIASGGTYAKTIDSRGAKPTQRAAPMSSRAEAPFVITSERGICFFGSRGSEHP